MYYLHKIFKIFDEKLQGCLSEIEEESICNANVLFVQNIRINVLQLAFSCIKLKNNAVYLGKTMFVLNIN